ncbi:aminotransferase class III-fold pyridoxal phosphate-dependent enzyme [Phreatobacter stygius]|uniref:Aminotransferase class III-fold pyridoxal phosphate-dependent enzyme n=1 Tax=Phreatobacter stygius TaxID=1940610 RepID=A0A4D7BC09_9HYPH|nr:aminotransferase class III-fold pyridoxal phosphate-dependent enzyme [Phreatobacter stygius]QCI68310.1 aminotransferase class III-fold pyridoxal phosphate-dependent enzyme [Phreatobacter stygius]
MRRNSRDAELRERARLVIPGGMYGHESAALLPDTFPQYFARADGAYLWDCDGNRYVDYMCAFGPNLLGYRHPAVEAAAAAQAAEGDTMTGPSEAMVVLAEDFVSMISHADWAIFCKNGSDATSMAMVTARAYRDRKKILVARSTYHGASPWNTPSLKGIVPEDRAHIITFDYNDLDSAKAAFRSAEGDVAGVFATPFRHEVFADQFLPSAEYATGLRRLCDEADALLIIDEVRTGFRLSRDCSWAVHGVAPDLSAWGKVLGNGHPISALLGSDKARQAASSIYVTGSFWFSAVPMAAAIATLNAIRSTDYLERIVAVADRLRDGIDEQARRHGIPVRQTGPAQMPLILFDDDPDMRKGSFWTGTAARLGVYMHPYHNMFCCAAMTPADVDDTLEITDRAFAELKNALPSLPAQPNERLLQRLAQRR